MQRTFAVTGWNFLLLFLQRLQGDTDTDLSSRSVVRELMTWERSRTRSHADLKLLHAWLQRVEKTGRMAARCRPFGIAAFLGGLGCD